MELKPEFPKLFLRARRVNRLVPQQIYNSYKSLCSQRMKLSLQEGKKGNTKHACSVLAGHTGQHSTLFFFSFFSSFIFFFPSTTWQHQFGGIHLCITLQSFTFCWQQKRGTGGQLCLKNNRLEQKAVCAYFPYK